MRFDSLQETLTRAGVFRPHLPPTGQAAKDWLAAQWSGKTIGLGGSMTPGGLGPVRGPVPGQHRLLALAHPRGGHLAQAAQAQVYLSSVNAVAETGELINIDGTGTGSPPPPAPMRWCATWWGGTRWPPTFDQACGGPRNVAAPLNARLAPPQDPLRPGGGPALLRLQEPGADLQRAVRPLAAPGRGGETMVLLVDEDLGY